MDEVLAAEVFHPAGDVRHELHQHLRREELQDNTETVTVCAAGGAREELLSSV